MAEKMAEKKASPSKARNKAANEARHAANVARVAALGLPPATAERSITHHDRKGMVYTVTVSKPVRASKLLRLAERSARRRNAALVDLLALADEIGERIEAGVLPPKNEHGQYVL